MDDGVWITLDRYLPQQDANSSRQRSLSMSESASEDSEDEEQQHKQQKQQASQKSGKDRQEDGKEIKSLESSPDPDAAGNHEEDDGTHEGFLKTVSSAEEEDEEWLISKTKRNDRHVSSSLPAYPFMLQ